MGLGLPAPFHDRGRSRPRLAVPGDHAAPRGGLSRSSERHRRISNRNATYPGGRNTPRGTGIAPTLPGMAAGAEDLQLGDVVAVATTDVVDLQSLGRSASEAERLSLAEPLRQPLPPRRVSQVVSAVVRPCAWSPDPRQLTLARPAPAHLLGWDTAAQTWPEQGHRGVAFLPWGVARSRWWSSSGPAR